MSRQVVKTQNMNKTEKIMKTLNSEPYLDVKKGIRGWTTKNLCDKTGIDLDPLRGHLNKLIIEDIIFRKKAWAGGRIRKKGGYWVYGLVDN